MNPLEPTLYPELEADLRTLGAAIDFPPTPDLAAAVTARITQASGPRRPAGPAPERRAWLRPARVAHPLLLAGAILLVLAAVAAAWVVVRGLAIVPVDALPSAPPPATTGSGVPGSGLRLGDPVPLADVAGRVGFAPLVPAARLVDGSELGTPDAAYVTGGPSRARVAFAWAARPGLPAAPGSDAGLLVEELLGATNDLLVRKLVDGDTTVRVVRLADGTAAYWIAGGRHAILYQAPTGQVEEAPIRLATESLVFNRGDVLVRVETSGGLETALAVADSLP